MKCMFQRNYLLLTSLLCFFSITLTLLISGCGVDRESIEEDYNEGIYGEEISVSNIIDFERLQLQENELINEITVLYDPAIDDYPIYKSFVYNETSAYSFKKPINWIDTVYYEDTILVSGINFVLLNFEENAEICLGMVKLYSDGVSELIIIREDAGILTMGLTTRTITNPYTSLSTKIYSNGIIVTEQERDYEVGISQTFSGKDISIARLIGDRFVTQYYYIEYYDEIDKRIDYDYGDCLNDSETCTYGEIDELGEIEVQDEALLIEMQEGMAKNISDIEKSTKVLYDGECLVQK